MPTSYTMIILNNYVLTLHFTFDSNLLSTNNIILTSCATRIHKLQLLIEYYRLYNNCKVQRDTKCAVDINITR